MAYSLILSILLISLPAFCMAQSSWEFSVEAGPAFPVGKFGESDAMNARVYSDDIRPDGYRYILYYSFENNGFAETGWFTSMQTAWRWNSAWKLLLQYRYSQFPVKANIGENFTQHVQREHSYYQSDYRIQQVTSGLGMRKSLGEIVLDFQVTAGIARSNFPYYKILDEYHSDNPDRNIYPKMYYGHEGSRKADNSFIWGASALFSYQLNPSLATGIRADYSGSSFDYHINPRWIPGGSGNLEYDDKINYDAISLGVSFTFTF